MARFRVVRAADLDLLELTEKIALENPSAARNFVATFERAVERIAFMPGVGHFGPDFTDRDLRFWPLAPFLIVYDPTADPVTILRLLDGRRDLTTEIDRL